MLFLFNDDRRRHIPKMRFQVTNWAAQDAGLRLRGSPTLWVSDAAITAWRVPPVNWRAQARA